MPTLIIMLLVALLIRPYVAGFIGAYRRELAAARAARYLDRLRTTRRSSGPVRIIKPSEHTGWGNSIRFSGDRWVGHMTPLPDVGDEIHERTVDGGIGRFIITRVEPCGDPRDMFFAYTVLKDYIEAPPTQ
jgi:hypothetical protein